MMQIILNDVTYSIIESSNGTDKTLNNVLKDKIISYLLEDEEFYGTIKLSQGSFGDFFLQFAIGGALGAVGYCSSKGISSIFANKKIFGILGNITDNSKVNKKLASLGYSYLKIGRDGLAKIYSTLYKDFGFEILEKGVSYFYDFLLGVLM